MSEVFNCVNCGKQNIVMDDDPPDVMCEFPDKNGNRHPLKLKEGSMVAQINTRELRPETRVKLGIDKIGEEIQIYCDDLIVDDLNNPVPPRPDLTGKTQFNARKALHKYYEDNAPAIIADSKRLSPPEMRKRWGFSYFGWETFCRRHHLHFEPRKYEPRKKVKTSPRLSPSPLTAKEKEVDARPLKFPAFKEEWPSDVCIAWMNAYVRLYEIDHPQVNEGTVR